MVKIFYHRLMTVFTLSADSQPENDQHSNDRYSTPSEDLGVTGYRCLFKKAADSVKMVNAEVNLF